MDIESSLITAREIGRRIGATPMEVNRLLKNQGFLFGDPGAYGLTPKGQKYGSHFSHENGYGGYARRSWETTRFTPEITAVLDSAPARLAEVRAEITAHKEVLSAAKNAARAEAELRFRIFQESQRAASSQSEIDPRKVLIGLGCVVLVAGTSYGVYRGVRWYRRHKAMKQS